ncbi:hypothetical protein DFQ28_004761 [Apophysomyces sp. BC1034]|nr:hypothetical protein DFQ30_004636 [Apophysomyces sp. BC1015]KAG0188498.1 hypothetical protein DFQ28_004761 [Apophysomyces sp. BC1034]
MFFDRSHSILSSHVPPSLPTAQALVILCWYSYLTGDMKTTTDLRRRLVLCVKELELSRDPEPTLGIVLMELHRRAYWVIYVTEQWLASCTGEQLLPVSYDCQWPQLEDSQLYVIDDIENKLTFQDAVEYALQLHTFAEMIKLARILETRSKASLTEWLLSLPSYLEYGKLTQVPSAVARIYHILYFTVQILISCEQQQQPHNNTCTAANTIVYIAEQMLNDHQEKYLYKTFLISLTLAATVHLDNTLLCYDQAELNLSKTVHVLRKTNNSLLNSTDLDHVLHQFLGNSGGVLLVEPERNPNKRSIEETDATTNIIQPSSIEMADFFFSDNDFNPSTLMLGSLPLPSPPISCDSFTIPVDNPCVSDSSSNCYISPRPSPTLEKDNLLLSLALTDTFFPEEYINI